jgi:hypothetical protein
VDGTRKVDAIYETESVVANEMIREMDQAQHGFVYPVSRHPLLKHGAHSRRSYTGISAMRYCDEYLPTKAECPMTFSDTISGSLHTWRARTRSSRRVFDAKLDIEAEPFLKKIYLLRRCNPLAFSFCPTAPAQSCSYLT